MAITHVRSDNDSGSLGADLTVDLTPASGNAINVADLCIVTCRCTGTTLPTVPVEFTTLFTNNTVHSRVIAYRVKQSADDTFTFVIPGTAGSSYVMDVFRGVRLGSSAEGTNDGSSGTVITYPAVAMSVGAASYVSATWATGTAGNTQPSGYTELNDNTLICNTAVDLTTTPGSLTPGNGATASATTNRLGWHIELEDPLASGGPLLLGVG